MNNYEQILAAAHFAADKHKFQRRKGYLRIPYINHPLKVAHTLTISGENDSKLLISALLHDVLEDTNTTESELIDLFGKEITSIVKEVTDDMKLPDLQRKELQVIKAPHLSREAKLIKIADKLCNINDILCYPIHWSRARKVRYAEWSLRVFEGCKGQNEKLDKYFLEVQQKAISILKR
jgi:guanosine-3',5'-bis(diphosphate) 3'-pyrophosphohydrolase